MKTLMAACALFVVACGSDGVDENAIAEKARLRVLVSRPDGSREEVPVAEDGTVTIPTVTTVTGPQGPQGAAGRDGHSNVHLAYIDQDGVEVPGLVQSNGTGYNFWDGADFWIVSLVTGKVKDQQAPIPVVYFDATCVGASYIPWQTNGNVVQTPEKKWVSQVDVADVNPHSACWQKKEGQCVALAEDCSKFNTVLVSEAVFATYTAVNAPDLSRFAFPVRLTVAGQM